MTGMQTKMLVDRKRTQPAVDALVNAAYSGTPKARSPNSDASINFDRRPRGRAMVLSEGLFDDFRPARAVSVPHCIGEQLIRHCRQERARQALWKRMKQHPFELTDED
ncbi:MAG: hypothetical protein P4L81_03110 [Candidatus Pacebacteria bacterium]|nr:hypothetical protein [Candidatus Paceibacterota bacterium]